MQAEETTKSLFNSWNYPVLILALFLISFIGLFIPIMEVDASQYASISQEVLNNNSWFQITDLGQDYLDKPPLLFWISSASIGIFGNSSWAFKLPSFILAWASVYFLYRLCLLYYNKTISQLASLLYVASVGFILFTNDIRTDTLLISFVVFAVWQLASYLQNYQFKHLFLGAIGLGLAMLAKGPIGAVVPCLALAPHLFLSGRIKALLKWQLLLVPIIILVVLSPMLYGLYEQFSWHGIRFFFWEQSFGRITGENVWQNDATYFYFLHNIAWAFAPFILFLIAGLIHFIARFKHQVEYISFFGFVLPFIALSFSHYKLPHYIYIVIPFAAILGAKQLHFWYNNSYTFPDRLLVIIQSTLILALLIVPILLILIFDGGNYLFVVYGVALMGIAFLLFTNSLKYNLTHLSFIAFILSTFTLNIHGYPKLLHYQGSSAAAIYIQEQNIDNDKLFQQGIWWRAFHYYSGKLVPEFNDNILPLKNEAIYVFTKEENIAALNAQYATSILKKFPHFNVTRLSLNFLNPATRETQLSYYYLLKIEKHHE